jgi:phosphohistidine swiveling domain-containing protein
LCGAIPRGLAAILVPVFNGHSAEDATAAAIAVEDGLTARAAVIAALTGVAIADGIADADGSSGGPEAEATIGDTMAGTHRSGGHS